VKLALAQRVNVIDCEPGKIPDNLSELEVPCLLKGLVKHWPIVDQANQSNEAAIRYLLQYYQGKAVTAFLADPKVNGRFFYNDEVSGFNFIQQNVHLDELLNKLLEIQGQDNNPTYYVGSTAIAEALPGFLDEHDLDLNLNLDPNTDALKSIWLGNQSVVAPHFDFPDNIACSIIGKRRFTLFPPDQLQNLYVGPIDLTPAGQQISMVELRSPDLQRYPKFAEAMKHALIADLEAGDALFIPSMWWHQAEGLSDINGLVNFWWRNTPEYLGSPTDPLLHALLSLKALPPRQRKALKTLFDYYIFDQPEDALDHLPEQARGRLGTMNETMARQLRAQLLNNLK
jgi:hypothetical protein